MATKAELIEHVAEAAGVAKAAGEKAVNALTQFVTDTLKKGDSLTLPGFGTFSVGERSARTGRNPQTGAEIQIAAAKVAKFKAGSKLKEEVNK